jgi:hypothetical protein
LFLGVDAALGACFAGCSSDIGSSSREGGGSVMCKRVPALRIEEFGQFMAKMKTGAGK